MSARQRLLRLALVGLYLVAASAFLYWYSAGDSFCSRQGHLATTIRLALACTVWDILACALGSAIARKAMKLPKASPLLTGTIAVIGVASVPFWIYRGYGVFLFEGSWADVSCFFAEGSGIAFPVVVAPAIGLMSLVHGLLLMRLAKGKPLLPRTIY